jgi:hypothetical protein
MEFNNKNYPYREIETIFNGEKRIFTVSTFSFHQALSEDLGIPIDTSLSVRTLEMNGIICIFIPDEELFKAELQSINILSEDDSHFQDVILKQMDEWNCAELFEYHKDFSLLDDDETFEEHINNRPDLLESAKEHRRDEVIPKLSLQELLDRYKRCF